MICKWLEGVGRLTAFLLCLPPPQEKVLHNIMPIFTFMGASVMRLDDAYSFCVIDKTVQMVIPALIQVRPAERRSLPLPEPPHSCLCVCTSGVQAS